ncbi:hypothetical protein [Sandaracinobacteroides saxicola]|uniref:FtsX-like permease family protein n=1 Tax=Sandaracinobacteroides saxicola TaxID=2759707 RepID=A0A7G5IJ69_9SPHN|nr:hypothetical protein [Sandaracinobacteroides saxicola]QMW23411.1 hypothetical protein H3309_02600 [Sandaracinobacteroides saxicola]
MSAAAALAEAMAPARLLLGAVVWRDTRALLFTLASCGIASVVAAFQLAVYTSFLLASSAPPRLFAADLWLMDRSIEVFDMPTPMAEEMAAAVASEFPGAVTQRMVVGFAPWSGPAGARGNVLLIGMDDAPLGAREFRVDASEMARLALRRVGDEAAIGGVTMRFAGGMRGLASYIGAPYAVVPFDVGRAILRYPAGQVAFVAVRLNGGRPADFAARLARLQARWPDVGFREGKDFIASSAAYWQNKTGAGAAILLAAGLAMGLNALLLVNGVGRFVQRRQADIISLIGHGSTRAQIGSILVGVASLLVAGAYLATLLLCPLLDVATDAWLPWVHFTPVNALAAGVVALLCWGVAVVASLGELRRFPADAIFRS